MHHKQFHLVKSFVCTHFKYQTALFDTINRTLSGATAPSQSGPVSNANEGVPRILQSSSITRVSLSEYSVSYQYNRYWEVLPDSVFYIPSRLGFSEYLEL